MFRITMRDAAWLAIAIIASVVYGCVSSVGCYVQGYEHGLGNNAELVNTKYNLDRAKACLKKHGLWPECGEE